MEQNLWLAGVRFSFWYWKLGGAVKKKHPVCYDICSPEDPLKVWLNRCYPCLASHLVQSLLLNWTCSLGRPRVVRSHFSTQGWPRVHGWPHHFSSHERRELRLWGRFWLHTWSSFHEWSLILSFSGGFWPHPWSRTLFQISHHCQTELFSIGHDFINTFASVLFLCSPKQCLFSSRI